MNCECGYKFESKLKSELIGNNWCIICPKCQKIYELWEKVDGR